MFIKTVNTFFELNLRCPDCHGTELDLQCKENIVCFACSLKFPIFNGSPVLLKHDNEVFSPEMYSGSLPKKNYRSKSFIKSLIPSISVNLVNFICFADIDKMLAGCGDAFILVIGSSTQRTWLSKRYENSPNIHLVCCDIDTSAIVDCYCDAHELPFVDDCFDGVIITAVLELVLYPERVASEIHRVLKPGGLLYSELPFMQQVHEGAYDFTRYTLSGHRRLFNHFSEIKSGMVAGPATALVWSIENFTLSFFGGPRLRTIVKAAIRCTFFWLKYIDYYLCKKPQAMDGASCTYFLGEKISGIVSDKEIINRYVGGKHLEHI